MSDYPFYAVGNLTADPEHGTTDSGTPYARIRLAVTPRRRTASGEWISGETAFERGVVWSTQALNVVESLHATDRVMVMGRVEVRTYVPTEGQRAGHKTTVREFVVDEIGPTLKWATVIVEKTARKAERSAA